MSDDPKPTQNPRCDVLSVVPTTDEGSPSAEAGETLSPSLLWPTRTAASYELKFVVSAAQADDVEGWARQHLTLDPHADAALGNAYQIRSIYVDTPELDVYHQAPAYKRRKLRLRRYGSERGVFLERKSRSGDRVAKRRTLICDEELSRFRDTVADPVWPAFWFQRRLLVRRLQPRCVLSYRRVAHVGMSLDGPLRLTLDRDIHCALTETYNFHVTTSSIPILTDVVILELKFRASLPAPFKGLIERMGLHPSRLSKYRAGIDAWGLAASAKEVG